MQVQKNGGLAGRIYQSKEPALYGSFW